MVVMDVRPVALIVAQSVWPAKIVTVFPDRMERYFSTDLFRPFSDCQTTQTQPGEQPVICCS